MEKNHSSTMRVAFLALFVIATVNFVMIPLFEKNDAKFRQTEQRICTIDPELSICD